MKIEIGDFVYLGKKAYLVVNQYETAEPGLIDYALTDAKNVKYPEIFYQNWQDENCWYLTNRELERNGAFSGPSYGDTPH